MSNLLSDISYLWVLKMFVYVKTRIYFNNKKFLSTSIDRQTVWCKPTKFSMHTYCIQRKVLIQKEYSFLACKLLLKWPGQNDLPVLRMLNLNIYTHTHTHWVYFIYSIYVCILCITAWSLMMQYNWIHLCSLPYSNDLCWMESARFALSEQ